MYIYIYIYVIKLESWFWANLTNYGTWPFFIGKSRTSMAIFNSKLAPEEKTLEIERVPRAPAPSKELRAEWWWQMTGLDFECRASN